MPKLILESAFQDQAAHIGKSSRRASKATDLLDLSPNASLPHVHPSKGQKRNEKNQRIEGSKNSLPDRGQTEVVIK